MTGLPNKPISVFTKVKRLKDPPNKEFTRNILQNLTFTLAQNRNITVDMFKNRKKDLKPVLSFQVNSVPAFDIPNPVKVRKDVMEENPEDKIKNIPCPFDDCEELVSRLQFRNHCRQHREEKIVQKEPDKEKNLVETEGEKTGSENIHTNDESSSEEAFHGFPDILNDKANLSSRNGNCSVKEIEGPKTKKARLSGSITLTASSKPKAQSSILSFFRKFVPKDETSAPVAPVELTPVEQTVADFKKGRTVEEIAAGRGLPEETIYTNLGRAIEAGEDISLDRLGITRHST